MRKVMFLLVGLLFLATPVSVSASCPWGFSDAAVQCREQERRMDRIEERQRQMEFERRMREMEREAEERRERIREGRRGRRGR